MAEPAEPQSPRATQSDSGAAAAAAAVASPAASVAGSSLTATPSARSRVATPARAPLSVKRVPLAELGVSRVRRHELARVLSEEAQVEREGVGGSHVQALQAQLLEEERARRAELERELDEARGALAEAQRAGERAAKDAERRAKEKAALAKRLEADVARADSETRSAAAKIAELQAQLEAAETRCARTEERLSVSERQTAVLTARNNQLSSSVDLLQAQIVKEHDERLKQEGASRIQLEYAANELERARSDAAQQSRQVQELESSLRLVREQLQQKTAAHSALDARVFALEKELREAQQRVEQLQSANQQWQHSNEVLSKSLQEALARAESQEKRAAELTRRLTATERERSFFQGVASSLSSPAPAKGGSSTRTLVFSTPGRRRGAGGSAEGDDDSGSARLRDVAEEEGEAKGADEVNRSLELDQQQAELLRGLAGSRGPPSDIAALRRLVADEVLAELRALRGDVRAVLQWGPRIEQLDGLPALRASVDSLPVTLAAQQERALQELSRLVQALSGDAGRFFAASAQNDAEILAALSRLSKSFTWLALAPGGEEAKEGLETLHQILVALPARTAKLVGPRAADLGDGASAAAAAEGLEERLGDIETAMSTLREQLPDELKAGARAAMEELAERMGEGAVAAGGAGGISKLTQRMQALHAEVISSLQALGARMELLAARGSGNGKSRNCESWFLALALPLLGAAMWASRCPSGTCPEYFTS